MASQFNFEIAKELPNGLGRAGLIRTPHGDIETPAFAVVGTHATVKYLTPDEVRSTGATVMLSNGYHLYRKAAEIDAAGGLAEYSGWRGPTMTDSGGFQVMSLGSGIGKVVSMDKRDIAREQAKSAKKDRLSQVSDSGVSFRHPTDGKIETFTPEVSMQIQHQIGADIMMAFDELTSIGDSYEYNVAALRRTHAWARRCLKGHQKLTAARADKPYQALYGVLQGAHYKSLRRRTAGYLGRLDFDGYGLGGAFEKERLGDILQWCNQELPKTKPRHLLGLSKPDDIFVGAENGVDTFDCVAPTREARHGRLYTLDGNINIRNSVFAEDDSPIDAECDCPTCQSGLTRAELRRLLKSPESADKETAFKLASIHNVHFIVNLLKQIRHSILAGNFIKFRDLWLERYYKK
ncbi:MAG: tRNA guanosine(34) transglycosylase Tgt [Candidatus Nomurabacteria bacterium]|jgi:queuine tRNA-ribosyltransferase|nr:tRNA guanosine(34) transglycosylase Tgt [Candidatus Nomurabacteria bacterium]